MVGQPSVISALRESLPLEAQLNLTYRLYAPLVHFMGIDKTASKLKEFGDDAHVYMRKLTKQLLFLTSNPTGAEDPDAEKVSYSVNVTTPNTMTLTGILQSALAMEEAIARLYDDKFNQVCWDARDEETRHLFKDLIHFHRDTQRWLEKQLRLISGLGESEYAAEKL